MQRKTFKELFLTISAHLLAAYGIIAWIGLGISEATWKQLTPPVAAALTGLVWIGREIWRVRKIADATGTLPAPQPIWSFLTGKIPNRSRSLAGDGRIFIFAPADAQKDCESLEEAYGRNDPASPLNLWKLTALPSDSEERKAYCERITQYLKAQNAFAVALLDDGSWNKLRDVDRAIRVWGSENPERPIIAIRGSEVTEPSLDYNSVPLHAIVRPPHAGLTNKLLQQTANRGETWQLSAATNRYIALVALAVAAVSLGVLVGELRSRLVLERRLTAFRSSLTLPIESQNAILTAASGVRGGADSLRLSATSSAMFTSIANALRESLIRAHSGNPENTNVVFLAVAGVADTLKLVEIARGPSDTLRRTPFEVPRPPYPVKGIAPCALRARLISYWSGEATTVQARTSSIEAWSGSAEPVGTYTSDGGGWLHVDQSTKCAYLELPREGHAASPDDERTELLCVPVATSRTLPTIEPVGVICASSNEKNTWLKEDWARAALVNASLWLASAPWSVVGQERMRPWEHSLPDRR